MDCLTQQLVWPVIALHFISRPSEPNNIHPVGHAFRMEKVRAPTAPAPRLELTPAGLPTHGPSAREQKKEDSHALMTPLASATAAKPFGGHGWNQLYTLEPVTTQEHGAPASGSCFVGADCSVTLLGLLPFLCLQTGLFSCLMSSFACSLSFVQRLGEWTHRSTV